MISALIQIQNRILFQEAKLTRAASQRSLFCDAKAMCIRQKMGQRERARVTKIGCPKGVAVLHLRTD